MLDGHAALLHELTSVKPGITPAEIQDDLRERGNRAGSLSTIWAMLRRLHLSHKKSPARG
ncbi:MAG: hypothetical protein JWM42_754 [Burkholderia sp.]|jgi:hypothetical protein|nr:hypothetical protein [Burkholderia sp.]